MLDLVCWVSLYCLCISWSHLCVKVQIVCLFGLLSNSWVRSSFWCLEYVVHLYLRCSLGVCSVFLCWAVGYVSLEVCFPLKGSGSVGVRIYWPGRVCHGVERSG